MTIILFLVDSSASMSLKCYQGTRIIDIARSIVELFIKQRVRDASARGDRYMLMSFEDFPANVKCGWRESQSVFQEQLRALKPRGLTTFGSALGSAFRFVNVNRMQTGIDNYGCGRYPYYIEPVVIVCITDGNCLMCPSVGVSSEVKVAKPSAIGNELTEEPFRWDHRLFTIALRLTGHSLDVNGNATCTNLPSDDSPMDAMCLATGGRSYCVTSLKMISVCVESIVQKIQQQGVLVSFEKHGPDPSSTNGLIGNYEVRRNGNDDALKEGNVEEWRSVLTAIYSRAPRSFPGFWPIPEAFWPDKNLAFLPPRKAHPVIMFRCEPCEPLVCQDFPFDKYELESSPLTQFILERKQPGICWQVFVLNSSTSGGGLAPFGYLKLASNLQCVNLFIMPYNYPALLPLIEEAKVDAKAKQNQLWRMKLERYLSSVPSYYLQPLKKAFARFSINSSLLEPDQVHQYSYNILSYLTKIKHVAREEFNSHCAAMTAKMQQPNQSHTLVTVVRRNASTASTSDDICDSFHGLQIHACAPKKLVAPSLQFTNPFEISREKVVGHLLKMRLNLTQRLAHGKIPIFEGGRPGSTVTLQHTEDLHNLPVSQMGNYQEYVKGLEAIGRGTMREVEPQAIRVHAFGNPFKIDKKNFAVDEVNETSLLSGVAKNDCMKKRAAFSNSASSMKSDLNQLPRRKPGPLADNSLSSWRRKRSLSACSDSSGVSTVYEILSSSTAKDCFSGCESEDGVPSTSHAGFAGSNGYTRKRPFRHERREGHPEENSCVGNTADSTLEKYQDADLLKKKQRLGILIRQPKTIKSILASHEKELWELCVYDRKDCLRYSAREALRFKRKRLAHRLSTQCRKLARQ